jgi:hypothetical protein
MYVPPGQVLSEPVCVQIERKGNPSGWMHDLSEWQRRFLKRNV